MQNIDYATPDYINKQKVIIFGVTFSSTFPSPFIP